LANGEHSISIRATDSNGISAEATHLWNVDTTNPTISLNMIPAAANNLSNTQIVFSSFDNIGLKATECSVDNGAYASCVSPFQRQNILEGNHTVVVRVTDKAGNLATVNAQWLTDLTVPTVMLTAMPAATTTLQTAAFSFLGNDASSLIKSYECQIDNSVFSACTSPMNFANLAVGAHRFGVRALDNAGNTSQISSYAWTILLVPPAITTPLVNVLAYYPTPVRLIVAATGSQLVYQWLKDNVVLAGRTAANLMIAPLSRTDSGVYRVNVSNAAATVSSQATVEVRTLLGTWSKPCIPGDLYSFTGQQIYNANNTFSISYVVNDTLCTPTFPGFWRASFSGTYTLGNMITLANGREAQEYNGFTTSYNMTPITIEGVLYMNQNVLCGISNWALNVTRNTSAIVGCQGIPAIYNSYRLDKNAAGTDFFILGDRATGDQTAPNRRPTAMNPSLIYTRVAVKAKSLSNKYWGSV